MLKKILLGVALVALGLQFFQIDKTNPEFDPAQDIINITSPPTEVASILKTACYDCHSYQTKYPWYTNIQPLAWWIKDHIDHGREELNFSEWDTYSFRRADHKLEESSELVLEHEMPLPSYLWAHSDARLTDAQIKTLTSWFDQLRENMQAIQDSSITE